ncbi:F-box protein At3g07870-like [Cornus florida]|uniref:F-box protein At3g07870-like n=1 Tax=Cornus florida TaxID=4283 RepID=UPI00289B62D9|nr:F-box protein At3g07870-like [Cornus florida]
MSTMSVYVPPDLLIQILRRLPVKSLIRFTSVCKSWYFLITNPNFITTHLNQTIASNKNQNRPLLLRYYNKDDEKEHYTLRHDDETFSRFLELEFPFKCQLGYVRIVGSCNGLLCLSDDFFANTNGIFLWNPSIRQSLVLPAPNKPESPHMFVLGFGVDIATNDYKVVRLVYCKQYPLHYEYPPTVEIYTVSSGLWRSLGTPGPSYGMVELLWSQAFVNGAVHWIAFNPAGGGHNLIVSFDMGNEVFSKIMLPDALAGEHQSNLYITVVGECLSVFRYGIGSCCIWVMKEYGVVKSWTELVTVNLPGATDRTLGLRKNGEVLLSTTEKILASYDPKTQQIKDLGIQGNRRSLYVDTYMETLVLLKRQNRFLEGQLHSFEW